MRMNPKNIAILGCSGGIGSAFTRLLADQFAEAAIHAFSRQIPDTPIPQVTYHSIDYGDESSVASAANLATSAGPLDLVIVAIGLLHDELVKPEKSLRDLSAEKFHHLFEVNTIRPALIAKQFLPKLNPTGPALFAALSARVGSISDNLMGGWYAYRASKAALNMILKNAAIEVGRRHKQAIVVGLYPGVVDSPLSKPFQASVPAGKLFSPDYSVRKLLDVLDSLTPEQSGRCFDWDGTEVQP